MNSTLTLLDVSPSAPPSRKDMNSEHYYGSYRDLNYKLFTSNKQFMDPHDNETVNGVPVAFSRPFFDDFGDNSSVVTNFTSPPLQVRQSMCTFLTSMC